MRSLVILVAVSCCSAQLVLPSAPWVLPTANLIANPDADTEVKPVALPYFNPYAHHLTTPYFNPLGHHLATPYAGLPFGHHLPYVVAAADGTLKATEFPYIYEKVEAEEPAVETASRRRRDVVSVPLPYFHAIPTLKKATIETKQFEPTDAATPADTTKIELTTTEHEISVPAIKYVQPHVNLKPVTYTAVSPAFAPYHAAVSPAVWPYHAGFPAYSGLYPYHYPTLAAAPVEAEEPAVETASRRRRDVVSVPLPYFHAIPTLKKATIETKQFEPTDAATPADTTKIELTTREHEISVPAIQYVQPHVNLKPVTYTAVSPAFAPYHAGFPAYSGLYPYHYPTLATAPVIKFDEE